MNHDDDVIVRVRKGTPIGDMVLDLVQGRAAVVFVDGPYRTVADELLRPEVRELQERQVRARLDGMLAELADAKGHAIVSAVGEETVGGRVRRWALTVPRAQAPDRETATLVGGTGAV